MPRESGKTSRSSKTNKTSHVLSLLTSDGGAAEELTPTVPETEPEAETPASAPEPPAPEPKAPKRAARPRKKKTEPAEKPEEKPETAVKPVQTDDHAIAAQIRSALEDALKAEEAEEPPPPRPAEASAPAREKVPEPIPEPAPQAEAPAPEEPVRFDLPSFDQEPPQAEQKPYGFQMAMPGIAEPFRPEPPGPAPEPAVPEPEPAPEPPAPAPEFPPPRPEPPKPVPKPQTEAAGSPDEEPFCFNVMEALVESKAEKYIDLFGLCPCPRCRTDVIALALTRLPAKYVVATRADLVPLLSVYEGRYNAAVVSQVMRACNRVAEQPRHKKP